MLVAEIAISDFVAQTAGPGIETVLGGVPDTEAVDPVGRVVLTAQRLEPEKHTCDALDAWHRSGLVATGWELWVAGDGSERGALGSRAAQLGTNGVRFLGQRADLSRLRADAGIFLATASAEPFGLSVVEAMACGLPVVAAGGGGHFETIGRATPECLYPPGDTARCAQLLEEFACDVDRRRRVGAVLRAYQQRSLSLSSHVDRLVEIYQAHTARTEPPGRVRPVP
jgi:glycosyltransferase involved in cell wall biosynthesis